MNAPIPMAPDERDVLFPNCWLLTKSGLRAWPMALEPRDVCLEDIAHCLACENRFNGHTRVPISVAQHSVFVAEIVLEQTNDPMLALGGLLHDATEAYLKDIPKPVKRTLGSVYKDAEHRAARAIGQALGIDAALFEHETVKRADVVALVTEKRDMRDFAEPAWSTRDDERVEPHARRIIATPWQFAKRDFLETEHRLRGLIARRG